MRWYWSKILLGALGVFAVGYGGVVAVREAIHRGRSILETADPITIPLAFIPFTIDGREIGTFQRVTILRDAPQLISGVDVQIRVRDTVSEIDLAGCRVTTRDRRNFDLHDGFVCLPADVVDNALVAFGTIRLRGPGQIEATVPLLLDSATVSELRQREGAVVETQARIVGQETRVQAERVSTQVRQRADSIAKAARSRVQPAAPPPPPD